MIFCAMTLNNALERIKQSTSIYEYPPKAEVECIRQNRDAAIPVLLDCIKTVVEKGESLPYNARSYYFAMYLLAEFRVNEAFPILIKYLEFDEEFMDFLLGDDLTESFSAILASVATLADVPELQKVVANNELFEYCRYAALDALKDMYAESVYPRADYFAFLKEVVGIFADDANKIFNLTDDCYELGCNEAIPLIVELYRNGLDGGLKGDEDFSTDDLSEADLEKMRLKLLEKKNTGFVKDMVKWLS